MARSQCFAERRGKTWRGRYPDPDGRLRSTSGFPTKKQALQAAREARAAIEAGTWRDPRKGEITLAEWTSQIWPTWDIELTTRANYSAPIRRFILPAFGEHAIASISREEIDAWERKLTVKRGYSVEYIRGARRRLHTILADAVTAGHIDTNPASRQRGPRPQSPPGPRPGRRREGLGRRGHGPFDRGALRTARRRGGVRQDPADSVHRPAMGRGHRIASLVHPRPGSPPQSSLHSRRMAARRAERQVLPRAAQRRVPPRRRPAGLALHAAPAHQTRREKVPESSMRRRGERVRVAGAVPVPGSRGRPRPAVQLRRAGVPPGMRRPLPGRETPPRVPARTLAGALLQRAVASDTGPDDRKAAGEGRAAGRMLLGATRARPHPARLTARAPDRVDATACPGCCDATGSATDAQATSPTTTRTSTTR